VSRDILLHPLNTLQVILEMCQSRQSLTLVQTTGINSKKIKQTNTKTQISIIKYKYTYMALYKLKKNSHSWNAIIPIQQAENINSYLTHRYNSLIFVDC